MPDVSLDRAVAALGEMSASVRGLTKEVIESESLRLRKIRVIQQVLYVMVPAMIILVLMAVTNFILLSRAAQTGEQVKATNDLVAGCFQPNTTCSNAAKFEAQERAKLIQQSQFVSLYCARQNPVDEDPQGTALYACFRSYYPNFVLPTKQTPTPRK